MEELKLQLEAMQQRWEDDHRHLVRLEAAGERVRVLAFSVRGSCDISVVRHSICRWWIGSRT